MAPPPAKKRRRNDDGDGDGARGGSGGKRRAGGGGGAPAAEAATVGQLTSGIRNKLVRGEKYSQLKHIKKKAKGKERRKRHKEEVQAVQQGLEPPPRREPKTLENTREADETVVKGDDEEVAADEEADEFAAHFQGERPPKVLLTTSYKPTKIMYTFLSEMMELLPHAQYYRRGGHPLKKICQYATGRGFTDVMVFHESPGRRQPDGLVMVHLPDGPTATFRLSNLVLGRDIQGHGRATQHKPELILNNFSTRLGARLGRMFAALFPQDPQFRGRRVVTFHNQRDFVFVRHHRYIFEEKEKRVAPTPAAVAAAAAKGKGARAAPTKQKAVVARLQELGPRFTLRLQSLQKGTFDTKQGEFEWLHKADMDTSRRRFHL